MPPSGLPIRFFLNPGADPSLVYGANQRRILSSRTHEAAYREISTWSGYVPTPLRPLPGLASRLGVGEIWYKDEGNRFGLGSFKALGGIYGVFRVLQDLAKRETGVEGLPSSSFQERRWRQLFSSVTVTCASAGNHGRAVARGAEMFGCRCVVFLPEGTSPRRTRAIEKHGARTTFVDGSYDEAVLAAARESLLKGWHVVSDTSLPGYQTIPRIIMQGYSILAREVLEEFGAGPLPTHVFLQAGVGGLAGAVAGFLWERLGPQRPRVIVVEPAEADCLLETALRGKPTPSPGSLDTTMDCLACRKPSRPAWGILKNAADAFMTISDQTAMEAVDLLAEGPGGDPKIITRASGAAGVAGLSAALFEPQLSAPLDLGAKSRILAIGSEGAA